MLLGKTLLGHVLFRDVGLIFGKLVLGKGGESVNRVNTVIHGTDVFGAATNATLQPHKSSNGPDYANENCEKGGKVEGRINRHDPQPIGLARRTQGDGPGDGPRGTCEAHNAEI